LPCQAHRFGERGEKRGSLSDILDEEAEEWRPSGVWTSYLNGGSFRDVDIDEDWSILFR
jgi:hypothetical protein